MSTTNTVDWFFANTRTNVDTSRNNERTFADRSALSYQTGAVDAGCSDTLNPASAMADQPGMIAIGGYGMPGAGCKVDENSELRWGSPDAWRVKGPKQLWVRPFSTTPNLGGGEPTAVNDESYLIHSQLQRVPKDISTIMDKFIPNYYQPLIPSKDADYQNVNNWVEMDGWTRGGDPTRLIQAKRETPSVQ